MLSAAIDIAGLSLSHRILRSAEIGFFVACEEVRKQLMARYRNSPGFELTCHVGFLVLVLNAGVIWFLSVVFVHALRKFRPNPPLPMRQIVGVR